tara:strand:- start:81909 stop:82544 length:636 start_codon:yes stop_codon:yes gene_type:complete
MINPLHISAIIFDLGGVILHLDYNLTVKAFEKLGMENPSELFSKKSQTSFFDDFETGKITAAQFRTEIKDLLPGTVSDSQIDAAWNAMLLDFPLHRFEFIQAISTQRRIFLLSNTNEIHMKWFKNYVNQLFGENEFFGLFEVTYLSNEMGLRKPDVAIFNHVVAQNKLDANSTLFIDDSPQHVAGAKEAGLHAHWLQNEEDITELLCDFLA